MKTWITYKRYELGNKENSEENGFGVDIHEGKSINIYAGEEFRRWDSYVTTLGPVKDLGELLYLIIESDTILDKDDLIITTRESASLSGYIYFPLHAGEFHRFIEHLRAEYPEFPTSRP